MEEKNKVTIIVPIYNVEQYIHKCVDSILKQTYGNLEVILVDDGSPDSCPRICDAYKENDIRVRVIHKVNGGLSDARNAGLDAATGDYITFIDADDYYAPNAIEKLMEAVLQSHADIVCMEAAIVSSDYQNVCNEPPMEESVSENTYFQGICEGTRTPSVCTKLFRKSLLHNIRFKMGRLNEDFYFTLSLLFTSCTVKTIPFVGYYYYQRKGSISHSDNKESLRDAIQNCIDFMRLASGEKPAMIPYIARMGLHQSSVMIRVIPENVIKKDNVNLQKAVECIKICRPYISEAKLPIYEKIIARCALISPVMTAKILRKVRRLIKK